MVEATRSGCSVEQLVQPLSWGLEIQRRTRALLRVSAIVSSSLAEYVERSVPFSSQNLGRRLVFSLVPRCQGECGSQKQTGAESAACD